MTNVLAILTVQCLLGAFDNFWHHEMMGDLSHRPSARAELALHAARNLLYALIFAGIAWYRWQGGWAAALILLLGAEIVITAADFVVEDRTRRLPPLERVLHSALAVNFGIVLTIWAPELRLWLAAPTGLAPASYGTWSWLMTMFGAGALAGAARDLLAAIRLGVPTWQLRPMKAAAAMTARTVLVTGATGFIGRALTRALVGRGDHVIALSRDPAKARDFFGPLVEVCGRLDELGSDRRIDAIVNLAGEALGGGFWTAARKRRMVESRVGVTGAVVALVARLTVKPAVLISGSGITYYGDRCDERLTETSAACSAFTADLCQRWEAAALEAVRWDVRVCRLRIGLVLGPDGGVLPPLARAARFYVGAVLGSGRQFVSWIHRDDLVRLILFAMDDPALAGPVNAVAPEPMRQADFIGSLGHALHRPVGLRLPGWALRRGLGQVAALLLGSQRVLPDRASAAGFHFAYPTAAAALQDLLRRQSAPNGRLTVFVNDRCPVCRIEMQHYAGLSKASGGAVDYVSIDCRPSGLPEYGLTQADLRRRLFVQAGGELRSGIDAVQLLWSALPIYRHLAMLVRRLPGVRSFGFVLYEGIAVPVLAWWTRRRLAAKGLVA